jgi:serine/threonine protein kinase
MDQRVHSNHKPSATTLQCVKVHVAAAGDAAQLVLSLAYAAPEVVLAHEAGARTVVASQATDIWAIGVMAFELLTTRRAFLLTDSTPEICDKLCGRAPLPWEPGGGAEQALPKLGVLRKSVLRCLSRDTAARPSAAELAAAWHGVFDLPFGVDAAAALDTPTPNAVRGVGPRSDSGYHGGTSGSSKSHAAEVARQESALQDTLKAIKLSKLTSPSSTG